MATEIPGFKLSGIAATQLTQYTFVTATTGASAMTVSPAASGIASARLLGVVQNAPTTGAVAEITVSGVSKVYAAGAINAGAGVTVVADGKAAALAVGTGAPAAGIALSSTTGADQLVTVLLNTDAKS